MSRLESRIPPPAVALVVAGLMWLVTRMTPTLALRLGMRETIALTLAIVGVAIAVAGAAQFRRAKTTVNPMRPEATTTLVTSGIYRLTRNPMYLGMATLLLGCAYYLSHPLALLGVVAFVAYIHRFQIIPEERAMRALFPGAYEAYARQVRRWL